MAQEFEEIIVISATNGKTTTARMVSHATHESGIPFVANTSGANLPSGIATALLQRKPDEKYEFSKSMRRRYLNLFRN